MGTRGSIFALAAGVALGAGAAEAATINQQQNDDIFSSNGRATVTITDDASPFSGVRAGAFALTDDGADPFDPALGDFVAFCLDIFNAIDLPSTYETTETPFSGTTDPGTFSATQVAAVQTLFNTAYATVDLASNAAAAGFQLALWEVLYEDDGATEGYDIDTGDFSVSASNGSVLTAAQGFLDGMTGANTGNWELTYLQSTSTPGGQNLVTMAPIPLPAGGVLLLGALGGLAIARRRRKA